MDKATVIFFIITLINVVLSTMKSVLTVKASRTSAALINAIAYGFYALVVKQMASVDITTVVLMTVISNLIGVYFSMWLLDKFKNDMLWKITVIPEADKTEGIKEGLVNAGLGFNEYQVNTKYGNQSALDIFSQTQAESKQIKDILKDGGRVKYHISEIRNQL